jgi:hypothetical protein
MTKLGVMAMVLLTLASAGASAQGRGTDAALGALSGAVVFGPVGAVAGALVGYTAGPSIAHSWGLKRSSSRPRPLSRINSRAVASRIKQSEPKTNLVLEQTGVSSISVPPTKLSSSPVQTGVAPPVQELE